MANAVATSSLFAEQQAIFQTAGDVTNVRRLQEFHRLFGKLVTQNDVATDAEVDAWEPAPADQHAAWEMYVELRTRISTQPLHYLSGDEGSARDGDLPAGSKENFSPGSNGEIRKCSAKISFVLAR